MAYCSFECCKGCENRQIGCHSTCEKYTAAVAENEKIKEVRFNYNKQIWDMIERKLQEKKRCQR